ncbi:MAG: AAA family ATPase [Dechloromonas sp.]|nr:AAA family ATPase [Dechloromonas sp.]
MADFRSDQAAGLRRLFGGGHLQVVSFAAGCSGVGKTAAVANLGVALARQGREVLLIDEASGGDDLAAAFGLLAPWDLLHVVQRECSLEQVLVRPQPGLHILPASRAAQKLGALNGTQQNILLEAVAGLARPIDVILIDAGVGHRQGFSPLGLIAQETVFVLSGNSASITEAYTAIKKLSQVHGRRNFRILINKVRCEADARAIFDNMAHVAAQRGIARLEYVASVPLDEAMRQTGQLCRPVVSAAPESVAAEAFRDIAAAMADWARQEAEAGGVEHFMQQLLHLSQRIPTTHPRI